MLIAVTTASGCHGDKRFGQFYPLIDEKQRGLTGGANSDPNHHRQWIFAVLDDRRRARSLDAPAPVVLLIVGLFDGEVFFIRELNLIQVQR